VFEIFWKKLFLKKFVRGWGSHKRLDLGQNTFKICLNWESRVSPGRHSRGNNSPKLGVFFLTIFRTPVSQKRSEISKCAKEVMYFKFKDLQIWFCTFFDISNGFWDIVKKQFLKKVCQGLGVAKTSWLGQNTFKIFAWNRNRESFLDGTVEVIFPQN